MASRLSLNYVQIVIILATIVPPYTTFLYGFGGQENVSIATYALLWAIYPSESAIGGLHMLDYYALSSGLPLGFFNIIFAVQVIRFLRGEASRRSTYLLGFLTLVLPILSLIVTLPTMISMGVYAYIGPIPIQLATGLLLMHLAGPKEPTAPW